MLSKADNELLCRIGPGTPMGEVFRRYWNPICMTEQIPKPDEAPLRLEMLGEWLVLFRGADGRLGLLDEACLHRGASLALGRVEADGIRCLYHGWKFATDGALLETPNHPDPKLRQRVSARAYAVREAGGFVWAYMGPKDREPPFPHWRFFDFAPENVRTLRLYANVNYMQQLEGGTDTSHVGILHSNFARPAWMTGEFRANDDPDNPATLVTGDLAPELDVEDTEFGFHYAAMRELPARDGMRPSEHNVRVVPVIMPTTRVIPAPAMQYLIFEIPVNDTRTVTFGATYRHDGGPIDKHKLNELGGRNQPALLCPDSYEYLGTWANAFGQRRETMKDDWSGIKGVAMEDMAISMSQGAIADRSKEVLVAADKAVVRARRQLLESAKRVAAGGDPIGVNVDVSRIVAVDENQPRDARWQTLVPTHRPAVQGAAQTEEA
ncbi:MAG: Rieske 2Fe-2S domain-containing protein [Burkholderiaceae bacterium]